MSAETKAELMAAIDTNWTALQDALRPLIAEQMAQVMDDAGWAVKDHVIHLAGWERLVVFLLSGRPGYLGLEIDEALYRQGSVQAINDAVFAQTADWTPEQARVRLGEVHAQLPALLAPLSDADLQRPAVGYLSSGTGAGTSPALIQVVYENTAKHYAEHLEWIQALVGDD